jgi:hypothetical protein
VGSGAAAWSFRRASTVDSVWSDDERDRFVDVDEEVV